MVLSIVLAVAINAYIIMHSCLDAIESTKASSQVVEVAEDAVNTVRPNTITPDNHESFAIFIRKAFGHFFLFMISCQILCWQPDCRDIGLCQGSGAQHCRF